MICFLSHYSHNPIEIPDHIHYEAKLMFSCPVTPETSLEDAQKMTKGNHVTVRGRILEVSQKIGYTITLIQFFIFKDFLNY